MLRTRMKMLRKKMKMIKVRIQWIMKSFNALMNPTTDIGNHKKIGRSVARRNRNVARQVEESFDEDENDGWKKTMMKMKMRLKHEMI
jgi:phage gpG-like protein